MFTKVDLENKNILIRLDLDVPEEGGKITNNFRLQKVLPTVVECLKYARKVCLVGHRGRPTSPQDTQFTLDPVKKELENKIRKTIQFFLNSLLIYRIFIFTPTWIIWV